MALFNPEQIGFDEDLSRENLLIPAKTLGIGKVVSATVTAKYRGEDDPKYPETIWTQLSLTLATRGVDVDFKELVKREEVKLRWQPYILLADNGMPAREGNANFQKLLDDLELSVTDPSLRDGFSDIDPERFVHGKEDPLYNVTLVKLWWENLGKKFIDHEFDVIIGQNPKSEVNGRVYEASNFIATAAKHID